MNALLKLLPCEGEVAPSAGTEGLFASLVTDSN